MSSPSNRYDRNNEKYRKLSSRGIAAGERFHYTSPQGKAIRRDQKFDHAMRGKREHREKMEKLHQILISRGGGKNPKNPPKRPKAKIRRKSDTPPVKRNHKFVKSKKLRDAAPTSITPASVYVSFLFLFQF